MYISFQFSCITLWAELLGQITFQASSAFDTTSLFASRMSYLLFEILVSLGFCPRPSSLEWHLFFGSTPFSPRLQFPSKFWWHHICISEFSPELQTQVSNAHSAPSLGCLKDTSNYPNYLSHKPASWALISWIEPTNQACKNKHRLCSKSCRFTSKSCWCPSLCPNLLATVQSTNSTHLHHCNSLHI